jgi:hypothetical protein
MENSYKLTEYVEDCDCFLFNPGCPRCWEAAVAMTAGFDVERTEPWERRKERWQHEQEDRFQGDLPFRVIEGGRKDADEGPYSGNHRWYFRDY